MKTVFVSDVHMGAGKKHDWFNNKAKLLSFLAIIDKTKDVEQLVLLGDIFDLWVCPHDQKPPTFQEICVANKTIIDTIKNMQTPVTYVNGNHDDSVCVDDINNAFDGKIKHTGDTYRSGNILATHGHLEALFNCPDPERQIPLGYYLTRIHTTLGDSRATKVKLTCEIINEMFQVLGPEKLPESMLDALRDCLPSTDLIFNMDGIRGEQSFEDVRGKYRDLYDDWRDKVGFWGALRMLLCETGQLGFTADKLCRDGVEIVVMGHSHSATIDKDFGSIYANCGCWCDGPAHCVTVDGNTVELIEFVDGELKTEHSKRL